MPRAYLELFAGGAACALALLGGATTVPPIGYMGGKRRLAAGILGAAGLRLGEGAEQVLLVDAGEWGNVWAEVVRDGRGLADRLLAWEGRDPSELWHELATSPPGELAGACSGLPVVAGACSQQLADLVGGLGYPDDAPQRDRRTVRATPAARCDAHQRGTGTRHDGCPGAAAPAGDAGEGQPRGTDQRRGGALDAQGVDVAPRFERRDAARDGREQDHAGARCPVAGRS